MKLAEKDILVELYRKNSKHSGYQILPNLLKPLIQDTIYQSIPRYEKERLDWVSEQLDFSGKKLVDIGGNTGYFAFEAMDMGAREVIYIEGNQHHAEFVSKAKDLLKLNIQVINEYFDFHTALTEGQVDIVLLFNVIHHLGDDFGDQTSTMDEALEAMKDAISYFQGKTEYLVLQMGFCWKGDRTKLLFEKGTKEEMISFIQSAIRDKWEIHSIGIAEVENDQTVYRALSEKNIQRDDRLGEFRNRPIFILKSK